MFFRDGISPLALHLRFFGDTLLRVKVGWFSQWCFIQGSMQRVRYCFFAANFLCYDESGFFAATSLGFCFCNSVRDTAPLHDTAVV